MRTTLMLSGAALLIAAICCGADDEKVLPKRTTKATAQPAANAGANAAERPDAKPTEKDSAKTSARPTEKTPANPLNIATRSADEDFIRQADVTFAKAFDQGDAAAVAAHFTPDAEYVDEQGNLFQGRKAIEEWLASFFIETPGSRLEATIDTIRFVTPAVAIEDGTSAVMRPAGSPSGYSHYTAVHVKTDGKWLTASVREHAPKDRREHSAQLQELDWLLGDWVDEDDDSIVEFSCQAVDNGNFLLRQFAVRIAGEEALSGTQRIGWDPVSGKLRAWVFDSEGGYGEGTWHREGDRWILKTTGVTADGQTASGTSIYTFVNEHLMTWQAVDHEIAGAHLPDGEVVTIVRKPPPPVLPDSPAVRK